MQPRMPPGKPRRTALFAAAATRTPDAGIDPSFTWTTLFFRFALRRVRPSVLSCQEPTCLSARAIPGTPAPRFRRRSFPRRARPLQLLNEFAVEVDQQGSPAVRSRTRGLRGMVSGGLAWISRFPDMRIARNQNRTGRNGPQAAGELVAFRVPPTCSPMPSSPLAPPSPQLTALSLLIAAPQQHGGGRPVAVQSRATRRARQYPRR